jgi:hypothetical protein
MRVYETMKLNENLRLSLNFFLQNTTQTELYGLDCFLSNFSYGVL